MEFRDLGRQYQQWKPRMDEAIGQVIREGRFISGPQVGALETSLAEYVGVKHCISCANGTDALSLVLRAWGVGEGDAVFVPDFTFFSTAETPRDRGATPIFVDVLESTFNMDPACLEQCVLAVQKQGKLKPKAIIAVDLFGMPADYERIKAVAQKFDLLLLEDAAQGFGGSQQGKKACSFGRAAITSFFPAKPLGCYGDGGAVFTDDEALAGLVRSLAVHGRGQDKYDNVRIGVNSRLDTLQAAILQVKLEAFQACELEQVNAAAEYYTQAFGDWADTPRIPQGFTSSWAQYTLRLRDEAQRHTVMETLRARGIPSMIYYARGMHQQRAFADLLPLQVCKCDVSASLCSRVLSLPLSPYITRQEQEQVVAAVREALETNR